MVYTKDLKSFANRLACSSHAAGTIQKKFNLADSCRLINGTRANPGMRGVAQSGSASLVGVKVASSNLVAPR